MGAFPQGYPTLIGSESCSGLPLFFSLSLFLNNKGFKTKHLRYSPTLSAAGLVKFMHTRGTKQCQSLSGKCSNIHELTSLGLGEGGGGGRQAAKGREEKKLNDPPETRKKERNHAQALRMNSSSCSLHLVELD